MPPSAAGGFRRVHAFVEFLKGQPQPPRIRFAHAGSYGIDGLLGTVGAEVGAPPAVPVAAITRDGLVAAQVLQVRSQHVQCGAGQAVRVRFAAPLKSLPLAYLATRTPLDPAKVRVLRLGDVDHRNPDAPDAAARPYRYSGFRIDLDGDGRPDLVIVQGRGPAELSTSGVYHPEDSLLSIVYANIAGVWKRVAVATDSGCT
jgi:hypothetical protein